MGYKEPGNTTAQHRERRRNINAQEISKKIVGILEDKKGEDIQVFDVKGKSTLTDIIIVVSGNSGPHLKALAGAVQRAMKDIGDSGGRIAGDSESAWIVLDLYDVIVHVFLPEAREYYDIEALWRK